MRDIYLMIILLVMMIIPIFYIDYALRPLNDDDRVFKKKVIITSLEYIVDIAISLSVLLMQLFTDWRKIMAVYGCIEYG